jgi:hypothetical protein
VGLGPGSCGARHTTRHRLGDQLLFSQVNGFREELVEEALAVVAVGGARGWVLSFR